MKRLATKIVIIFCFSLISSFTFAQDFPPTFVTGPFPTGTEVIRGDAPVDLNNPDEMETIHEYTAYRGTPVVDGDVDNDAVWNSIPWTAMNCYTPKGSGEFLYIFDGDVDSENYTGPEDITCWFKILWDDDHVYLALKKIDDEYVSNDDHFEDLISIWQDDAYQLVLDANSPDDIGGPLPSAEIGLALLAFSEPAYNSWRNTNGDPLTLAEGNGASSIPICDGKAFFGSHVDNENDSGYTETIEIAFVKWDEILADEVQMMSIMANDPDESHIIDALQWGQGIFSGKTADRYASILYSSSEAPATGVENWPPFSQDFKLNPNYPNPFNPTTTISFTLPQNAPVQLIIFDVFGREVVTLVDDKMTAGLHNVSFDGAQYASGVYFYHLKAGDRVFHKKMMLVK